jgi:hypothetical protein
MPSFVIKNYHILLLSARLFPQVGITFYARHGILFFNFAKR